MREGNRDRWYTTRATLTPVNASSCSIITVGSFTVMHDGNIGAAACTPFLLAPPSSNAVKPKVNPADEGEEKRSAFFDFLHAF